MCGEMPCPVNGMCRNRSSGCSIPGDISGHFLLKENTRAAGADNGDLKHKDGAFGDVSEDDWFAGVVAWGVENGIVSGYEDSDDFGPDHAVTREQVAVFLMRFAEKMGMDTGARGDLSAFPDGDKVSGFAGDAMKWAVKEGFIKGDDKTRELKPGEVASRAEVAAMLMRFCEAQEQR